MKLGPGDTSLLTFETLVWRKLRLFKVVNSLGEPLFRLVFAA